MTKEIIVDGVNVAGCKNYVHIEEERYKPECNCRLTTVERGYYCDTYATSVCEEEDCEYKQLKRLEQELKWANDEEKYLKDCCIKAGKELEKHSFKWDGKEKNLVVQALQLNQLYEELERENKKYYSTLRNIKEIVQEISYLGSRGERELKFKIRNILEDVLDEEIY